MELQERAGELAKRGLTLVAISYDAPTTLKTFADARGITFPLISDQGSAIIRRYGLLNETVDPKGRAYGVPWPGTFILDRQGRVQSRHFEAAYQERSTTASLLVRQGGSGLGPAQISETQHLRLTAAASDARVAPGSRVSLIFDITPGRGMHVYAPGKHTYQVVRIEIDQQPWLRVHPVSYPASEIYDFKPLNERVEVYMQPFRLVQDVTVLATPEVQKQLAGHKTLTLSGRLHYQACDDKLCYAPSTIPVSWTFEVKNLER